MPIKSRENLVGAWAFLIGILLAVFVGIAITVVGKASFMSAILGFLALLGLIVGYFVAEKEAQTFLLVSTSLVIVCFAGIQGLILSAAVLGVNINTLITTVLGALMFLFIPATIVVALKTVFSLATR